MFVWVQQQKKTKSSGLKKRHKFADPSFFDGPTSPSDDLQLNHVVSARESASSLYWSRVIIFAIPLLLHYDAKIATAFAEGNNTWGPNKIGLKSGQLCFLKRLQGRYLLLAMLMVLETVAIAARRDEKPWEEGNPQVRRHMVRILVLTNYIFLAKSSLMCSSTIVLNLYNKQVRAVVGYNGLMCIRPCIPRVEIEDCLLLLIFNHKIRRNITSDFINTYFSNLELRFYPERLQLIISCLILRRR